MLKYLQHWQSCQYYGKPAHSLKIDNSHKIFLVPVVQTATQSRYQVILKYTGIRNNAVIMKKDIRNQDSIESAKYAAIDTVLTFMHESAVLFSYGATNLRVLTGVSQAVD